MANVLEKIPETDPLVKQDQKLIIDKIIDSNLNKPGAIMVVLGELQSQIGYISESMQQYVANRLKVPVSAVHGVVSFYSFFTIRPKGRHTIKFCMGTACYVGGMPQLIDKAKSILGVDTGQTTPDGAITLEICRCVGACSQAPVVVIDEDLHGRLRPNKFPQLIQKCQD